MAFISKKIKKKKQQSMVKLSWNTHLKFSVYEKTCMSTYKKKVNLFYINKLHSYNFATIRKFQMLLRSFIIYAS